MPVSLPNHTIVILIVNSMHVKYSFLKILSILKTHYQPMGIGNVCYVRRKSEKSNLAFKIKM